MKIKSDRVDPNKLDRAILYLQRGGKARTQFLNYKAYYLKPRYMPWAKEVWVTTSDVFLPHDFNRKTLRHRSMDLHRAVCMFEEQGMFRDVHPRGWFITWATSRKIGYVRRSLNLRMRSTWAYFLRKIK